MSGPSDPWFVILAGGCAGPTCAPAIDTPFEELPPQFSAPTGGATLYERALERAHGITPPRRTLSVIGPGQWRFLREETGSVLLEQPFDRGSGSALMLATACIMARDPSATVLVLPSDHFISPPEVFRHHLLFSLLIANQRADRLLVLGAPAGSAESDYGWILPAAPTRLWVSHRIIADPREVSEFREKPGRDDARRLLGAGALWSTMICAVRAETLWWLGWQLLPSAMPIFEELRNLAQWDASRGLDSPTAVNALYDLYEQLPPFDLARHLMTRCAEQMLVLPMTGLEWSDWGRPERVAKTARRLGLAPAAAPAGVPAGASANGKAASNA